MLYNSKCFYKLNMKYFTNFGLISYKKNMAIITSSKQLKNLTRILFHMLHLKKNEKVVMRLKEKENPSNSEEQLTFQKVTKAYNESKHIEQDLTDEEQAFLEEVLQAQEEALREDAERRKNKVPPKKRLNFGARIIVWMMSFALIFSMFAFIFQMYSIPAIEFIKTSARLSGDEVIQQYKEAVVEVSTGSSKGTGFSISEDGYIVTNSHVIKGALQLTVVFPNHGVKEAIVIEDYPEVDLAVIKVEGTDLPSLQLANELENVQQDVIFIGNPLAFTGIANEGKVLGFYDDDLEVRVSKLDAPVYKGNSGSPVISENGEVIGVIYATIKLEEYGKLGLFIPIDALHERFELPE